MQAPKKRERKEKIRKEENCESGAPAPYGSLKVSYCSGVRAGVAWSVIHAGPLMKQ